jgi:hypothetical protein
MRVVVVPVVVSLLVPGQVPGRRGCCRRCRRYRGCQGCWGWRILTILTISSRRVRCSFLLPNDLRECTRATASVISFSTVARWITQHSEAEGARQAGTRKPPRKSTSRCTCSPPQSALAADGGGTEAHERGGPRTGCAHRMRCRGPRRSQRANRPRGPASRAERPAFGPAARAAPGAPPPPMPQRRTFGSRRTPAKWGGLRNSEAHLHSAEDAQARGLSCVGARGFKTRQGMAMEVPRYGSSRG